MALTKSELKSIGEKRNWKRGPLSAQDVQRMGSTEFDWHGNFNRLNLEMAMRKPVAGVPSPVTLALGGQKELAACVLARYPSYIVCAENAQAMNSYLQAIANPRLTEAEVIKAFEENCASGLLKMQLPNGRIVSGRDLMTLDSATYQTLVTPTTSESVRQRTMSSEDWKREHIEDFSEPTPDVIARRFIQAGATVREMPQFADLVFSHEDTQFLLAEMKRLKMPFTAAGIAEVILDNIERFESTEVAG
jgi:hypothetical protein